MCRTVLSSMRLPEEVECGNPEMRIAFRGCCFCEEYGEYFSFELHANDYLVLAVDEMNICSFMK